MWFGVCGSPQFVALAISEVGVLRFSCSTGEELQFLKECFIVVLKVSPLPAVISLLSVSLPPVHELW